MKYEEAMKRLEQIVQDIEENKLDIDLVSERLKEAQELVRFCKEKLYRTDQEIQELLADRQED